MNSVWLGLEGASAYTEDSADWRGGAPSDAPISAAVYTTTLSALQSGAHIGAKSRRQPKIWSEVMAQVCDICGKGPQFGNNISHAHNVTRRRWSVNLQAVKALVNGAPKRIRVCTSCIKTGKIAKA
jgi:large subunit ribosomal protein L28